MSNKNRIPKHADQATYAEWLKMIRHCPEAWLKHEMEMIDPEMAKKHVMDKFQNVSQVTDLLHSIAGLGIIAGCYKDQDGSNACADAMIVLANAYCTI